MKLNRKLYQRIITEPMEVQDLEKGKIEIHSMNQNEGIYNQYSRMGKFALWSSVDGKTYRLVLEDGYYNEVKELYSKRVNNVWLEFWSAVEKYRNKMLYRFFIPLAVITFAVLILCYVLLGDYPDAQLPILLGVVAVYIVSSVLMNKRIDKAIKQYNSDAITKIKNIVGNKRFDDLMDVQTAYYNKFFDIKEKEVVNEEVAPAIESETEIVAEEEKTDKE